MKDLFLDYEQSLALKHLGFKEICYGRWWYRPDILKLDEAQLSINVNTYMELPEYYILAPMYFQALKFFRDKFKLIAFIEPANGIKTKSLFGFYICDDEQNIINDDHSYTKDAKHHFKTYEQAEDKAIDKLIAITKDKQIK